MRYALGAVLIAAALAALLASCEEETDHYEYFDYSYIDTIYAPDTITSGQDVDVEFYYPGGCNRFDHFETEESGDTLDVSVVLLFYFYGKPCAHGPGYAVKSHPLVFSSTGPWHLRYRRGKSEWVIQDVYVR